MAHVDPFIARTRIPPVAYLLSGGFALALLVLATRQIAGPGHMQFFHDGDSDFFRRTAESMFGDGSSLGRAAANESSYRYGRFGFPFLAWLLAFGRPALVSWAMIVVYLVAMASIPGLAAALVHEYGAPAVRGAFVLLTPGILLMTGLVYAEALQIALILLACVLQARGKPRAALFTIAFAILVKETSVLALVPWLWSAWRRRDLRRFAGTLAALAPYAAWSIWVRLRIGEFPLLSDTPSRRGALSLPGFGFRDALVARSPNHGFIVTVTLATFVLCVVASWFARKYWIAAIVAAFAALITCYGAGALYYLLENLRLLSVPTVLAIVCLAVSIRPLSARAELALPDRPSSRSLPGARARREP